MSEFITRIKQYKWYLLLGGILLICIVSILVVLLRSNTAAIPDQDENPPGSITNTSPSPDEYQVLSTDPVNNATAVYAGEQQIQINLNRQVASANTISVRFSPNLTNPPTFSNAFPSRSLRLQINGGFQPNTQYITTVIQNGNEIYRWSFTTSRDQGESDTGLQSQVVQKTNDSFYPLIPYLPYATSDYLLGYRDRKKLKITLKRPGLNQSTILTEVKAWVRSKGIDPESHTYIFVQQ